MRVTRPINDAPLVEPAPFGAGRTLIDAMGKGLRDLVRFAVAVGLVALSVCFVLALATWSVGDPSLNHATDADPANLLGRPGAIIADMAMQVLGLAGVLAVLPLATFAWRFARRQTMTRNGVRLVAAVGGLCAAAGMFAAWPQPQSWPLPIGLGGFVGEGLIAAPRFMLSSLLGAFAGLPAAVLFAAAAFAGLGWGCGFLWTTPQAVADPQVEDEPPHDHDAVDLTGDSDEEEPVGRLGTIGLGFVMHGVLSAQAAVVRLLTNATVLRRLMPRIGAHDDDFAELERRLEPELAEALHASIEDRPHDEIYADEGYADDGYAENDAVQGGPIGIMPPDTQDAPSGRVQAMRSELKQGKRVRREAQTTLLLKDTFELPPLCLLAEPPKEKKTKLSANALEQNARLLEGVLGEFGVRGEIINVHPGPVVTLYELEPAPGTKSARVIGLADDIARSMSAIAARVAVVPGRNAIGIELPNAKRETVFLRELLASEDFEKNKAKLPMCLGKTIGGEPVIADLARMPHLLIAGTTGSGKSVAINTMILSMLYRLPPEKCKLIMIDPKMLELSVYDGIPHLLSPVVTDPKKAVVALKWTVREMEERYRNMSKLGVRNIDGFNARVAAAAKSGETITRTVQTGFDAETGEAIYETEEMRLEPMPYLVVIVDEMADLMMVAGKDIEGAIQRLAQMARAAGIHIIMATQRPSVDVITGTIKANFPTRISFQVTSKIDSRTILGEQGAEQLLGQGDMLFMEGGGRITRAHGPFVTDGEVEDIVGHLKMQGVPAYVSEVTEECADDPLIGTDGGDAGGGGGDLYDQAVAIVLRDKKVSTSYVQRRLSIGYNRAATLIERMEEEGVISRPNAKGQREILVGGEEV